ncbi:serine dehydratase subunit alpha family protein [Vallitalea guaymasensis]|uniref:L-cysteine desulfidase family protein n=1 Tax=Vallitalea guaymasensis TaxID=1185412 RepID=UPI0023547FF1|nr:L-serine ammonia-lyase, iron-sulfur-dependent, subunit alpha [Vallitalea guaymasensis]
MHILSQLIKEDMRPALGVTEPGAIALAVATARCLIKGDVEKVFLKLNSGMYKNAFTCGIPGSNEVGNYHAAALGAVAADPKKGLECLEGIEETEAKKAKQLVEQGKIVVDMSEISSRIFIEAKVIGEDSQATVTIRDTHTNIVKITENGKVIYVKKQPVVNQEEDSHLIHRYTLEQLYDYANTVSLDEIQFIKEAYDLNWELLLEGINSNKTTFARYLLEANGGEIISDDEQKTASLFCNAAIEARVIGLSKPAMSITGSGAHGIIATMPLYASYRVNKYSEEALLRATALSYLICMYIKEYSGKLSAFCGCAIAAGTGMACGFVNLRGGDKENMAMTINNMASSITGMICDGGNQGCTMKGVVAVDAAYSSVNMAMNGVYIYNAHGINGATPEETMKNMGMIASPGMVATEKTIVEILEDKK